MKSDKGKKTVFITCPIHNENGVWIHEAEVLKEKKETFQVKYVRSYRPIHIVGKEFCFETMDEAMFQLRKNYIACIERLSVRFGKEINKWYRDTPNENQ